MSGTYTPIASPELTGVPAATLTLWLGQAQAALHALQIGGQVSSATYSQGDGSKTVSYTRTDMGRLRAYVRELQMALGMAGPRRAIGLSFGRPGERGFGGRW